MTQIGASGWIGRAIELCSPGNKNNEMLRGVPDMKSSSLRAARFLRTSALGVSIAMAAVAAPAFAQDAPPDTATDDSDNTPIIVTAQGRSQLLSDVPVAISAVSAETLQNSGRSEEHTSELQSLMRLSYAVFCLKKKKTH